MTCKGTKVLKPAAQIPNFIYFQKSAYGADLGLTLQEFPFLVTAQLLRKP